MWQQVCLIPTVGMRHTCCHVECYTPRIQHIRMSITAVGIRHTCCRVEILHTKDPALLIVHRLTDSLAVEEEIRRFWYEHLRDIDCWLLTKPTNAAEKEKFTSFHHKSQSIYSYLELYVYSKINGFCTSLVGRGPEGSLYLVLPLPLQNHNLPPKQWYVPVHVYTCMYMHECNSTGSLYLHRVVHQKPGLGAIVLQVAVIVPFIDFTLVAEHSIQLIVDFLPTEVPSNYTTQINKL